MFGKLGRLGPPTVLLALDVLDLGSYDFCVLLLLDQGDEAAYNGCWKASVAPLVMKCGDTTVLGPTILGAVRYDSGDEEGLVSLSHVGWAESQRDGEDDGDGRRQPTTCNLVVTSKSDLR